MFTKSARFYDAIYSFKDYRKESEIVRSLLDSKKGGSLLDVGCGTGKHLEHLRQHFDCEGLDLDENLLAIARDRLPDVPLHLADMAGFDLGKEFDAVVCLFSAIGFMETQERLEAALRSFTRHTMPGGLILVEPWFSPEQWNEDHLHALFVDEPDLKIARMSAPGREGNVSTIGFEYLISTRQGIERASEMHRLGLFTQQQYLDAFEKSGAPAEFIEDGLMGRGLYLGRKP